jgi:hypothetical protein
VPMRLPKLFRINMADAVKIVGKEDSLLDTLELLQQEGAIRSFDFIVEVKVDIDKAAMIESFFFRKEFEAPLSIGKAKKRNEDDY